MLILPDYSVVGSSEYSQTLYFRSAKPIEMALLRKIILEGIPTIRISKITFYDHANVLTEEHLVLNLQHVMFRGDLSLSKGQVHKVRIQKSFVSKGYLKSGDIQVISNTDLSVVNPDLLLVPCVPGSTFNIECELSVDTAKVFCSHNCASCFFRPLAYGETPLPSLNPFEENFQGGGVTLSSMQEVTPTTSNSAFQRFPKITGNQTGEFYFMFKSDGTYTAVELLNFAKNIYENLK